MTRLALLLTAAVCLPLAACQSETKETETAAQTGVSNLDSNEALAADILSRMTLEEKVGQVIQADIAFVTPDDLRTYNLGSVLNGGNSAPGGGKVAEPQAWIDLADAFWLASTDTSDGGVGVPAIWGTDAVHGHNNLQTATIFPHNIGLGAANDPELMRAIGDVTAREIRATGLDWTFAPTLAVARDDRWGRAYESYSENPAIVASYAAPLIEGLQGKPGASDYLVGENVMATAKHFVGDGGTTLGLDKGDTIGTDADILRLHGAGYGPAIASGIQSVMSSFSSVNGEKMHGSSRLLTDVLRGELGFDGFVVGDWNGHAEIPGCTATDCPEALMAGIDMYMAPDSWKGLYDSLLAQARSGDVPMARLDEAVTRILEAKLLSGLFDAGLPSARETSDLSVLGRDDHRAIAREAVRKSLVLLKNDNDALPLQPGATVIIAGSGADSMQQQTGGWTLDWQGSDNDNDEFLTGESVYSGLKSALEDIGGTAILSEDGSATDAADAAIVIFGEQPYAEYKGDRTDLVYEFADGEDLALIRSFEDRGIPVVSVFLTGRPLFTSPHINASDAFVVAWLPGTEGGGVADVMVADADGKARHDFTGRLSFSWPEDGRGEPINAPDDAGVLFPFGYGLSYGDDGALAALSEEPGVENARDGFDGTIMARGDLSALFALYLGDTSNLNVPVNGLSGESLGGAISVRGVDYRAQEDSRQFTWSGNGMGMARLSAQRPVDLSDFEGQSLRVVWRFDDMPDGPMTLGMGCGEGCDGSFDLAALTGDTAVGEWTETAIPLTCFAQADVDLETVDRIFSLETASQAAITVHDVAIVETPAEIESCPS